MSKTTETDHAFFVESDIVKLNESGDNLLIEGFIGEFVCIRFVNNFLEILGLEGKLKINLNQEELISLLHENKQKEGFCRWNTV